MKTIDPKAALLEEIGLINAKTEYELIEIEQTNSRFSQAKGIKALKYNKLWDDTDPMNVSVKGLSNVEICGGELNFVDKPYPRKPVSGGTGRVAFILADKEATPKHSLSGEKTGWNLEFLASHYDSGFFKVVEPKWDAKVKARYEKILENIKLQPAPKKRDLRYDVRGINRPMDNGLVRVQVDNAEINTALASMQEQLNRLLAENQELKAGKKPKKFFDAPKVEEKKAPEKPASTTNFAE